MRLKISVINPELDTMTEWLGIQNAGSGISIDEFITKFNRNSDVYKQRTVNWSEFNKAELSMSDISAEATGNGTSFLADVIVDRINIYDVSRALKVPSPIAAICSRIGEKGLASSANILLKINKKIFSNEAVRQLNKRGMNAEAVYAELTA